MCLVPNNETQVCGYDPTTKPQSLQRKTSFITMTQKSMPHLVQNRKVAYNFDQCVVYHDYTEHAKLYYLIVLRDLNDAYLCCGTLLYSSNRVYIDYMLLTDIINTPSFSVTT
jgi:hypothetical protein